MPDVLWRWMANAIGLLGLTLIYALGIVAFTTAIWFATAFYAVLFAAIFYGANGALDALHGQDRNRPEVARSLGGLQIWLVLFPGVTSVSLGCALRSFFCDSRWAPSARSD